MNTMATATIPAMSTTFRIALRSLSADFARLGEEVRNVLAAEMIGSISTSWTTTTCPT